MTDPQDLELIDTLRSYGRYDAAQPNRNVQVPARVLMWAAARLTALTAQGDPDL
jgi:hypothetical protein